MPVPTERKSDGEGEKQQPSRNERCELLRQLLSSNMNGNQHGYSNGNSTEAGTTGSSAAIDPYAYVNSRLLNEMPNGRARQNSSSNTRGERLPYSIWKPYL